MKHNLNGYRFATCAALVAAVGCGSTPVPRELVDARTAYTRAASSDAAQLNPGAVSDAHAALAAAEKSYKDDEDKAVMRGKAYIALRKAERATVLASAEKARQAEMQANMVAHSNRSYAQATELKETQRALAQSNATATSEAARAERERNARIALMNVAKAESLDIKDDPRGTVVTVKVPFKAGKADLPPQAPDQLAPLAEALKISGNREIVVEGHTDSTGSAAKNRDLSQKRAETVREYLISKEVPPDHVTAEGLGSSQPSDTNATAEGRANNRVVKIVVKKEGAPSMEGE
jgi:outer membrane protein OmpA-like peptidoglycan-associated protein